MPWFLIVIEVALAVLVSVGNALSKDEKKKE